MCHDWPVKNSIIDLPTKMKGNLKRSSSDSLSPVRAHNKYIGTATQTLLIEVKLGLRGRLVKLLIVTVNMCDNHHHNQS